MMMMMKLKTITTKKNVQATWEKDVELVVEGFTAEGEQNFDPTKRSGSGDKVEFGHGLCIEQVPLSILGECLQ